VLKQKSRIPALKGDAGPLVQALVYSLIALSAAAIGALAYFGLTFTPANALLVAAVAFCAMVLVMERRLRLRAEARLERAIEELSRLLATDAQAGQVLGQRINAIADLNPAQRLETIEADISVLGTVIRQVAEAVADIEVKVAHAGEVRAPAPGFAQAMPPPAPERSEPVISLDMLRQALVENRLVHHIQPVVRLPQRRTASYDLVPRLVLAGGGLADAPEFMPRRGGHDSIRQIEGMGLAEAAAIARRSRNGGQPMPLQIPLSRATLGDDRAAEQLLLTLDANRAIAPGLVFLVPERDWMLLTTRERAVVESIQRKGASFSLDAMASLRVDVAELAALGVRTLRVDAERFIAAPEAFTDFHISDIANYLARFEVTLLATGIASERQIVELLDNEILLVQGPHIAAPVAILPDLVLETGRPAPQLRRVE
jgi:cyclic-di-GMP phosphodiesterase TipF (flagellum assembly factor)